MHVRMCVAQNQVKAVLSAKETYCDITAGYNGHLVTNDAFINMCRVPGTGKPVKQLSNVKKKKKNLYSMTYAAEQKCFIFSLKKTSHVSVFGLQQIDEMLAGTLTQEDEDAVLAELEAITQVGTELTINLY